MSCSKPLAALVKSECANYSAKLDGCVYGGACPVLDGARCKINFTHLRQYNDPSVRPLPAGYDYMQVAVAPLAVTHKPEHLQGARDYLAIVGQKAPAARKCDCGAELPRKKRMCDKCRKATRKASNAAAKRRSRSCQQLTPFSPSQPVV